MKSYDSVYRPGNVIQDMYVPSSNYYHEADVHLSPFTKVGDARPDGRVHSRAPLIHTQTEEAKAPVFSKEFSIGKMVDERKRPAPAPRVIDDVLSKPTVALTTRSAAPVTMAADYAKSRAAIHPAETSQRSKIAILIAGTMALIHGWYVAASSAIGRLCNKTSLPRKRYSLYAGYSSAQEESKSQGLKVGLLGVACAAAIIVLFFDRSVAPGTHSPAASNPGSSETFTTAANQPATTTSEGSTKTATSSGPYGSISSTAGTSSANSKPTARSNGTSQSNSSSMAVPNQSTPVGGYGGGSTGSIQPSGNTTTLPVPSPQTGMDIPGVTSPVTVPIAGQRIQTSDGKQIVGTGPVVITSN